jgi:hypothetical protein
MKIAYSFIVAAFFMFGCKDQQKTESLPLVPASEKYSDEEIESFKYSIIRYLGKLPGKADHTTKFDSIFDSHYINLAKQHELVYRDQSGDTVYFLVTRTAPSMYEKKVAIGGKLVYDKDKGVGYYEELFRTWKMLTPELSEKSAILYSRMIQGKDLSPYYTKNSKGIEYIEFPDDEVTYDTTKRLWVSKREDPLEELYDMKR